MTRADEHPHERCRDFFDTLFAVRELAVERSDPTGLRHRWLRCWAMAADPDVQVDSGAVAWWFGSRATRLSTIDPDAPLDDLEPLREVIGDARVVAVGEGAHFVAELGAVEARVVRFLVERCGFGVLALELGFQDGRALGPWLHGHGDEDDLVDVGGTLADASTARCCAGSGVA